MKACKECGAEKPLSDFYKAAGAIDGHFGKCKECIKSGVRRNRAANIEYYRKYDRERSKSSGRRERLAMNTSVSRANDPDKYRARTAVGNAIRDGRLVKPDRCSECGDSGVIHGHHEDYTKPLEVLWLCVPCHSARHKASVKAA